jgi:hypothetical protein
MSLSFVTLVKYRNLHWAGHVSRIKEMKNAHIYVMGEPLEKQPLSRP